MIGVATAAIRRAMGALALTLIVAGTSVAWAQPSGSAARRPDPGVGAAPADEPPARPAPRTITTPPEGARSVYETPGFGQPRPTAVIGTPPTPAIVGPVIGPRRPPGTGGPPGPGPGVTVVPPGEGTILAPPGGGAIVIER